MSEANDLSAELGLHRDAYLRADHDRVSLAARVAELEKANVGLADESQRLQDALRFYAEGNHFTPDDATDWDDVSGEPPNFLCGSGEATIEDGSVARKALEGFDWRKELCDDCGKPLGQHVTRIECPTVSSSEQHSKEPT